MFDSVMNRQPQGFAGRLLALFGLGNRIETNCLVIETDRFAALDDPATRKALSELSPHLLRDIGVSAATTTEADDPVEGAALRKYLW